MDMSVTWQRQSHGYVRDVAEAEVSPSSSARQAFLFLSFFLSLLPPFQFLSLSSSISAFFFVLFCFVLLGSLFSNKFCLLLPWNRPRMLSTTGCLHLHLVLCSDFNLFLFVHNFFLSFVFYFVFAMSVFLGLQIICYIPPFFLFF